MTPAEIQQIVDGVTQIVLSKIETQHDRYVNVRGAAELLGLSIATIERRVADGSLPSIKIGRSRRFLHSDLLNLAKGDY